MKRIDVFYGGQHYSLGGRDYAEVKAEVEAALDAGRGWLRVNYGEGKRRDADLLITAGASIVLIPVDDELPE
ncbi:MAG: hypothetical protein J0G30_02925 [Actinomycetales bacterium]|nr:hypothetical protein [Actinomycetales bacterium]